MVLWSKVVGALGASLGASLAASLGASASAFLLATSPAFAQDDLVTPMGDLEPLAEIIGAAHQLRQICDASDQTWRDQMLALIDMEAVGDDRRQRGLIDAFNAGFRRQEEQRLRCGADARQAESELAEQGRRLAEQLRDRYLTE